jgi:Tripartite tricarboxylate transporter family receptor
VSSDLEIIAPGITGETQLISFDAVFHLSLCKRLAMAIAALLLSGIVTSGFSQEYPSRPVRFIIIAAPGGQPDLLARILAPNLTQLLGQPFIVENLPGAGGIAAMNAVMAAPADGHVLLISDSSLWAINLDKTYATPEVITRLNANNMEYIAQSTPEHALEIIRADGPRWAAAVKLAGSGATE